MLPVVPSNNPVLGGGNPPSLGMQARLPSTIRSPSWSTRWVGDSISDAPASPYSKVHRVRRTTVAWPPSGPFYRCPTLASPSPAVRHSRSRRRQQGVQRHRQLSMDPYISNRQRTSGYRKCSRIDEHTGDADLDRQMAFGLCPQQFSYRYDVANTHHFFKFIEVETGFNTRVRQNDGADSREAPVQFRSQHCRRQWLRDCGNRVCATGTMDHFQMEPRPGMAG